MLSRYSLVMTLFRIIVALFVVVAGINPAFAAPESYSDPRMAIEAARKDGKKLIIFLLVDSFSKKGKAVEEAVLDQIKDRDGEFIIARCSAGSQVHRKMFTERFKKDVSRAPVAVVSNSKGEEVTGCYGVKPTIYRKMLTMARIKAGFVKDKKEVLALKQAILEGEDEQLLVDSIFGITLGDLKGNKVAMSGMRTWTMKNGSKFTAALLEGRGEIGIFTGETGEQMEVKFADLTDEDIEFLGTILEGGKTEMKKKE